MVGNATELREVFFNLVFNAINAMPSGGIIILRLFAKPPYAVAEVRDTGVGMTADVVSRCLEPFFTSNTVGGTGLGLSVCHGIINRHEGSIEIETQPGAGTTMRLLLPLAVDAGTCDLPAEAVPADPVERKKVLYIDDDPRVGFVMSQLLKKLGQQVDLAANGSEGLALFRANHYDLVMTDLSMPEISGREVTRIIKSTGNRIPVIILTGWGEGVLDDSDTDARPDYLLRKPISLAQLRETLDKVWSESPVRAVL